VDSTVDQRISQPGQTGATATALRLASPTARHECSLVAWPSLAEGAAWNGHLGAARDAVASLVRTIVRFEPVVLVAVPGEARVAASYVPPEVTIVEQAFDHARLGDVGPLVLTGEDGRRRGACFAFNGWGGRAPRHAADTEVAVALCELLGLSAEEIPLVLEGPAVVTDGAGTLVVTEQSVLDPARNPGRSRDEVAALFGRHLGGELLIWLTSGLVDDVSTDGHAATVVSFCGPRQALVQSTSDPADPDHAVARETRLRLEDAGLQVALFETLPHVECFGRVVEVPYANLYPVNDAVLVPMAGTPADGAVLSFVEDRFPEREAVGVPAVVAAWSGAGLRHLACPVAG
jgi:agmatine deiminase